MSEQENLNHRVGLASDDGCADLAYEAERLREKLEQAKRLIEALSEKSHAQTTST